MSFNGRHSRKHECAHLWASQSGINGDLKKNQSGAMFFDGETIFSYGRHFPIARFVSPGVVFFTTRSYSVTTSAHISAARGALYGLGVTIFNVHDPLAKSAHEHADNFDHYTRDIAALAIKASRARGTRSALLCEVQAMEAEREEYRRRYIMAGCYREPVASVATDEALTAARAADDERRKRESVQTKARREAQAVQDAERTRVRNLKATEAAAEWRAGTIDYANLPLDWDTMLRVNGDEIETSRGASVPLSVAPMLWEMVQRTRASGETREFVSASIQVGPFHLREVTADGDLIIGCHTLHYAELERVARTLGFTLADDAMAGALADEAAMRA